MTSRFKVYQLVRGARQEAGDIAAENTNGDTEEYNFWDGVERKLQNLEYELEQHAVEKGR